MNSLKRSVTSFFSNSGSFIIKIDLVVLMIAAMTYYYFVGKLPIVQFEIEYLAFFSIFEGFNRFQLYFAEFQVSFLVAFKSPAQRGFFYLITF